MIDGTQLTPARCSIAARGTRTRRPRRTVGKVPLRANSQPKVVPTPRSWAASGTDKSKGFTASVEWRCWLISWVCIRLSFQRGEMFATTVRFGSSEAAFRPPIICINTVQQDLSRYTTALPFDNMLISQEAQEALRSLLGGCTRGLTPQH